MTTTALAGFTSHTVAFTFIKEIVRLHEMPRSIVSNRDRVFLSKFWEELFHIQGTKLAMSSSYHPQTDGQTKALNKCLGMYLHCFVTDEPKRWVHFLPWAEYWYNTAFHTSIGMTSFLANYGHDPPTVARYIPFSVSNSDLADTLLNRDKILQ